MEVTKLNLNGNEYNFTDADAQSKINQIKENTYTKEFVDQALSDIDESLKDYAKSADVATNYQPKGNYLTEHQSLKNYYTKSEVDKAIDAIPAYDDTTLSNRVTFLEAIDHSQYLTEHQDISNLATKAEVKTVSDKVNAIKVPTKVSELTNDSKYQTESQVNSAIQKVVGTAPEALNTLEEIANKLNDNDDVVAGLVNTISTKADKSALNSYYNKTQVDDKIDAIDLTPYETVEGAAGKYQPIGSYVKVDGSNGTKEGVSTLLRQLGNGDQVMTDNTLVVTSYYSGQTTNNPLYYKRPANLLWSYIKGKADSVYLTEHQDISNKVDKVSGKELSSNDYTDADKNTVTNLKKLTSISHIKDTGAFTSTSTSVNLNFDCVSATNSDGNYTQHSEPIPVASSTSAGIITSDDKIKLNCFTYSNTTNKGISEIQLASAGSDSLCIKVDKEESDKTRLIFELSDNFGITDYSKAPTGTGDYILFRGKKNNTDEEVRVAIGKNLESINPTSNKLERVLNVTDLNSYLPLSGGTMTGEIRITNIRGTGVNNNYLLGRGTGVSSTTGVPSGAWFVGDYQQNGIIRTSGSLKHYDNTANATYTIWDSGNFNPDSLKPERISNVDLDDIKEDGIYYKITSDNTITNQPDIIGNFSFTLQVYNRESNCITQIITFTNPNNSTPTILFRTSVSAGWRAWKRLLTEDDLSDINTRLTALENQIKTLTT